MKTLLTTLYMLFVFTSCTTNNDQSIYVTVLADRTDTTIISPEIDGVKRIFQLNKNSNAKVVFRYQNIGNTDFNPSYTLELPSYSFLDNALQRKSAINTFHRSMDTLLQKENKKVFDYHGSNIFIPLVKHLEILSEVQATKKVLLLYSDISEYSDVFNCYSDQNRRLLVNNSEKVVRTFKAQINPKSDFKGIELYIIHYPKTPTENRLFQSLCKVYEETFKNTGLTIHIGIDKQLN